MYRIKIHDSPWMPMMIYDDPWWSKIFHNHPHSKNIQSLQWPNMESNFEILSWSDSKIISCWTLSPGSILFTSFRSCFPASFFHRRSSSVTRFDSVPVTFERSSPSRPSRSHTGHQWFLAPFGSKAQLVDSSKQTPGLLGSSSCMSSNSTWGQIVAMKAAMGIGWSASPGEWIRMPRVFENTSAKSCASRASSHVPIFETFFAYLTSGSQVLMTTYGILWM